jgi:hypothetical protein
VGPRTGLDDVENRKFLPLPGLELRPLGRPASSQSLYRLHYAGGRYEKCLWGVSTRENLFGMAKGKHKSENRERYIIIIIIIIPMTFHLRASSS